jgi:hypothetical protein
MSGHCVLNLASLNLLYQGTDSSKAAAAAVEGTHWAEGPTISAAIFRCAAEAGHIRRGQLAPRTCDSRLAPVEKARRPKSSAVATQNAPGPSSDLHLQARR